MKNSMSHLVVALGLAATILCLGAALGDDQDSPTIPDARQARLLERFGSEGIDADGDGALTHDEVKSFFADRPHGPMAGKHGLRAGMGHGPGHGRRGCGSERVLERHPEADLDGDGTFSDSEKEAFHETRRAEFLKSHPEADLDGNGVLSAEEARAAHPRHAGHGGKHGIRSGMGHGPGHGRHKCGSERILEHHPEADLDGDGTFSDSEKEAFHETRRAKFLESHPEADLDGNGVLSAEEARAAHAGRRGHCGGHGAHAGGCQGLGKGGHGPTPAQILEHHPEADLDSDGTLSESELEAFHANLPALMLERHPEADLDGDGTLSDEEVHSFMRARHGPAGKAGGCHGKGAGCSGKRAGPGCEGHGSCGGHGACGGHGK